MHKKRPPKKRDMLVSPFISLEYFLIIVGLSLQLMNTLLAGNYALRYPRKHNYLMTASMLLFCIAFVPLLIMTSVGSSTTMNEIEIKSRLELTRNFFCTHTILVGGSTLIYTLLNQQRFKNSRVLEHYPSKDIVLTFITTLMWIVFFVVYGVALPVLGINSPAQHATSLLWLVYVLLLDNLTMGMYYFYMRKSLNLENVKKELFLVCCCYAIGWASVALFFVSDWVYNSNFNLSMFLYRIAFSVFPLVFFGSFHSIDKILAKESFPNDKVCEPRDDVVLDLSLPRVKISTV